MSARYFLASSRIEQGLFLLHALPQIGIREPRWRDDVDRLGEQLLERLAQLEIGGGVLRRRALPEVGEEIEVARSGAPGAGTEQLQSAHAKARADASDVCAARFDLRWQHRL